VSIFIFFVSFFLFVCVLYFINVCVLFYLFVAGCSNSLLQKGSGT